MSNGKISREKLAVIAGQLEDLIEKLGAPDKPKVVNKSLTPERRLRLMQQMYNKFFLDTVRMFPQDEKSIEEHHQLRMDKLSVKENNRKNTEKAKSAGIQSASQRKKQSLSWVEKFLAFRASYLNGKSKFQVTPDSQIIKAFVKEHDAQGCPTNEETYRRYLRQRGKK